MLKPDALPSDWPEAIAEVLACRYTMRAGRVLAFGIPSGRHFRITYQYRVGDDLHTAECFSPRAMPQGTLFPIRYDPSAAAQHTPADTDLQSGTRRKKLAGPTLALVILGTLVELPLLLIPFLHGCR